MSTIPSALPMRSPNLKLALMLAIAGVLATLALWPYLLVMMPQKLATLPLPLPVLIATQTAQAGLLCWLLAWLGLYLGAPYGLDAPWLRAWIYRHPRDPSQQARWWLAIALGVVVGLVVTGLLLLGPKDTSEHATTATGWAWRGLLASFYGGTVEEVEFRLFPIGAMVWLLARCNQRVARPWMFVLAIVIAALLFGACHLPAAFATGMTHAPLPIARIVMFNALVGLVTGGLFWKYGLEHAMLAHFCADLLLHVAAPLAGG